MKEILKTREEINLCLLKGLHLLLDEVICRRVDITDEAIQAISDLGHPRVARCYSEYTLRQPDDRLRAVSCKDPHEAYFYAESVDKCPRDDTREAASQNHESAYYYALYVDKKRTELTWKGAKVNPFWANQYLQDMKSGRIKRAKD